MESVPQEERIFMLAKAGRFISNSPADFRKYAEIFPEDVTKIRGLFINKYRPRETDIEIDGETLTSKGNYPDDENVHFDIKEGVLDEQLEKKLFSLSALEIDKLDPELKELFISFDSFIKIAKKRNLAEGKLPEGFSEDADSFFAEYSEASDNFLETLDDKELSKKWGLKKEDVFNEKYGEMDNRDKSRLLRKFLQYMQYALIFRETFNSHGIEEESTRRENLYDTKNRYDSSENFNPRRQSLLYHTDYRPVAYLEETENKYGRAIEDYLRLNPHYRILGMILEEFGNVKSKDEEKENVRTITEFWNKNRSPLLSKDVCDALSAQNPSLAASELLDLIKKEKGDKDALLAALYRLELGKIGISAKGMDYLGEKYFDLGEEYNKPEKFETQRITSTGAIGIFSKEEGELVKYFYLEGLEGDEKEIKAKLMEITIDTLRMRNTSDSEYDILDKEKILAELKKNYHDIANDRIFSETGVRLNNLSFKEQGAFVIYFNKAEENAKEELREFVRKYGEDGIKTFLALEGGDEKDTGRRILGLGKEMDPDVARTIFEKYAQIVSNAEINQKMISDMFEKEKEISSEEIQGMEENMFKRADRLITDFSNDLEKSDKKEILEMEIIRKLSRINSENVLFSSVFKTAYESGEIKDFSRIKGLGLEIKNSQELSARDRKEIIELVTKNYEKEPARLENIKLGIEKSFESNISVWYILKKQERSEERIISILRSDLQRDGNYYIASQNVDPEFKSSSFNRAMNEKVLDSINEKALVTAISKIGDPASYIHINCTGWVANGIERNEKTGDFYYKFIRSEKTRDNAKAISLSDGELLKKFYNENSSPDDLLQKGNDKFFIRININDPRELEIINQITRKGYIVNRLIQAENDNSAIYHLFEKADL